MSHCCDVPLNRQSRCDCGAAVYPDSFRDRDSYNEFHLSGLCQACQDSVFIGLTDGDPPVKYALRRGALAASTERDGVPELGVLPFVFTAPRRPLAWEARYATRVVPAGAPSVDPYTELEALHPQLQFHQVRLLTLDSFRDTRLTRRFGQCELLIGLHTPALDRIGALCPPLAGAAQAPMAMPFGRRDGPFESLYEIAPALGAAMESLRIDTADSTPSALRLCAWMGALLTGPTAGPSPLFPEVLGQRPDVVSQCPPWRQFDGPPPIWVSERPKWQGYVS